MSGMRTIVITLCAVTLGACGDAPPDTRLQADTAGIRAEIDALIEGMMEGAGAVDAMAVLEPGRTADSLTLVVGDVILGGYDSILARFQETYANLERQDHTVHQEHIRVLGPDLVIAMASGEGTYTDGAGWTSEPVGIGLTLVFVRDDRGWHLTHAHQSIIE